METRRRIFGAPAGIEPATAAFGGAELNSYNLHKKHHVKKYPSIYFGEFLTNLGPLRLVHKHRQRILNLLSSAASGLTEQFRSAGSPATLLKMLNELVKADDSQPNGISLITHDTLEMAKKEIIGAVKRELSEQKPNPEFIASLIGDTAGIALVTKEVVQPILLNSLGHTASGRQM